MKTSKPLIVLLLAVILGLARGGHGPGRIGQRLY